MTDQQYDEYEKISWDVAASQARSNVICMESLYSNCLEQLRVYNKRKDYVIQQANFDALEIQKVKEESNAKDDSIGDLTLADDHFNINKSKRKFTSESSTRFRRISETAKLENKLKIFKN